MHLGPDPVPHQCLEQWVYLLSSLWLHIGDLVLCTAAAYSYWLLRLSCSPKGDIRGHAMLLTASQVHSKMPYQCEFLPHTAVFVFATRLQCVDVQAMMPPLRARS